MSSAAVQASQAAVSNRQYQQPAHGREQYYIQQSPNLATSPASSRKPSKSSGYGASSHNTPTTPQQPQYYSPAGSSNSTMTTPRAQPLPPSTHASPTVLAAASSAYTAASGPPIAPPPRTSSQQQSQTVTAHAQDIIPSPRSVDDRPASSRSAQQQASGYGSGSDRERIKDDTATAAATAAQSRRRAQQSPKDSPHQQRSSNRANVTPTHSRSATAVGSPPTGTSLPREESTIINRLVITDPQEDIAREQARLAEARPVPAGTDITPITGLGLVGSEGVDDGGRGASKSRQDQSKSDRSRKETKFGEYILGQTLGEGEFGKVKMGWKRDGGVQVAIKLIRRETLGSNPSRLPKIYREIAILRELQHPNIVRLHEMVETERHIGIILEYASGGELFDYILNHRYLKDNAARRLFAQLVSGVGYLHKKGIVHRDLKLENLLLDRNKNIIITDFGFANTFNPNDELGEEIEYKLSDKEFVKRLGLEQVRADGHRRGDLMQTSCGSPCYAAPELVVSDSLYTGRKVDVWSCGVILYAMLAGYLPFDDDPANPEGDNINLLYKYIVSTPLTFPEYVTPHAKDLLRRILVPDPRRRADLFEVARHSWLSEYAHVVGFITSSITTPNDIVNTTVTSDPFDVPLLARSASVREPSKPHAPVSPVGGLTPKSGHIEQTQSSEKPKTQRDAKRRTVQVEYVAPQSQTVRGETSPIASSPPEATIAHASGTQRTRARNDAQGPIEVVSNDGYQSSTGAPRTQQRSSAAAQATMPPPTRPSRDGQRNISDSTALANATMSSSTTRPSTGGTMTGGSRLPSRGNSYGTPAVATVAATNAQGRFSQPRGKQYVISAPIAQQNPNDDSVGRPSTQHAPANYDQRATAAPQGHSQRGHKRSNTVGGISEKIFGKSGSFFGSKPPYEQQTQQKPQKSYPPTSMTNPISNNDAPRPSTDSRRTSFGFSRKTSDHAPSSTHRSSRRFSFLPASLTGGGKSSSGASHRDHAPPGSSHGADPRRSSAAQPQRSRAPARPQMAFGRGESRTPSQSSTGSTIPVLYDAQPGGRRRESPAQQLRNASAPTATAASQQQHSAQAYPPQQEAFSGESLQYASQPAPDRGEYYRQPQPQAQQQQQQTLPYRPQYPPGFSSYDQNSRAERQQQQQQQQQQGGRGERPGVLQKPRKFADAYEAEQGQGHHAGSSGAARRVMDFFRKRGKARGG